MELKVNEVQIPERITFNYEELKAEIARKMTEYTAIYSEDEIRKAKADKASLNKLKKALNDERIRREREYMAPFAEFKAQINEIIAIIDKPVRLIDEQVKGFEERKKSEKAAKVAALFESIENVPDWLELADIYNDKWLNASVSMKSIEEEMRGRVDRILADLEVISRMPEYSFEASEVYKATLDINRAVREGERLLDIQRRKEEMQRQEAERAHREAEEKARREAEAARLVAEAQEAEDSRQEAQKAAETAQTGSDEVPEHQWVSFRAYMNVAQAVALKDFCRAQGIRIEAI